MAEAEALEQRGMFWFIRGNIRTLMICRAVSYTHLTLPTN